MTFKLSNQYLKKGPGLQRCRRGAEIIANGEVVDVNKGFSHLRG
jgi:hypothetical protein